MIGWKRPQAPADIRGHEASQKDYCSSLKLHTVPTSVFATVVMGGVSQNFLKPSRLSLSYFQLKIDCIIGICSTTLRKYNTTFEN